MTMDVYGHLIDHNLWEAAKKVTGATGDTTGTSSGTQMEITGMLDEEDGL